MKEENRKPDQRFYEHALEIVGVQPSEAIFLDDIGINCKAAQKFGMKAIRMPFFLNGRK